MKSMTKLRLGASALAVATAMGVAALPANAADLYGTHGGSVKDAPVFAPMFSWSGLYIGANVGYGWSGDNNLDGFAEFDYSVTPLSLDRVPLGQTYDLEADGAFGGGQIGYNWQRGKVVFGVEADIQASDIQENGRTEFPTSFSASSLDIEYFGTVRARLGYAFDRTLLYVTGGFAYGDVELKHRFQQDFPGATLERGAKSDTETGYAVGGGLEYALGDRWTIKTEYQYVDLGDVSVAAGPDLNTIEGIETDVNFHTVRFGVNYKLGGPAAPFDVK
jgi:outer membrane immunogenic protein